jgi:hypothetical protein
MSKLKGEVLTLPKMSGSVSTPKSLSGNVGAKTINIGGSPYEGEYVVTPKVDQQIMPTKGKVMTNDLTVKAVPVFRVSNTSGGTTVYIANEE